ncbi:hypothetical protein ONE63_009848 [Megalurothrips usitatus]|uniref:Inhibitor I9 domain-containing protein n=1 Tax=Megalurothrips usitatus TaxID=439358 RepID=A0AAV7XH01_9NEOP|nr:hypothetical protein ONE63_009848 [Megalurothrips usitatus]
MAVVGAVDSGGAVRVRGGGLDWTERVTCSQASGSLVLAVLAAAAVLAPADALPAPEAEVAPPPTDAPLAKLFMITQSPAQAIEDAIRYDPDVAAALQSNDTQLYLLKSVTYTNGTAEDLGLPKEELFPEGAPDRVRVADKIVYSSPLNSSSSSSTTPDPTSTSAPTGVHATLQLVPVPIN